MKVDAVAALRRSLANGDTVHGLWISMEAPAVTEIAVAMGLSYVVVDCEHGHLDLRDVIAHVRAGVRSNTCVFVRIAPSANIDLDAAAALVKRVLDIGADGVVVPNVDSPEQIQRLLSFARYPLAGVRGIGAERATAFGGAIPEHIADCAAQPPFVIPLLESYSAFKRLEELVAVEGSELFWIGPNDYSATKGFAGQWEGPGVADEVRTIASAVKAKGKHVGIVCTGPENVVQRRGEGFQLLALGTDTGLLIRGLRVMLGAAGLEDAKLCASLLPVSSQVVHAELPPKSQHTFQAPARTPFRVALTPDFYTSSGTPQYKDFGLRVLDAAGANLTYSTMPAGDAVLVPEQLRGTNGALVLAKKVAEESFAGGASDELLAISRFGVGYDSVDVAACTRHDVAVLIAAGAVDHSMAEATIAWMLHLTHNVSEKHALVSEGGWDARSSLMGVELRARTFGAVGLGGIARETLRLLAPFGMAKPIAFDPHVSEAVAASIGVRLVSLDELLRTADFVSIHCPLTNDTRGLIGKAELAKMRPCAYLLNTARGGIVDEAALAEALDSGKIAGAALDCFDKEPLGAPYALAKNPKFVAAPHCIGWTDELFRDIGAAACDALVKMSCGKRPERGVVNPEVFDKPSFKSKWERIVGSVS